MEKYLTPEMEIVLFDTEDVIATSGLVDGPDPGDGEDWGGLN